MLYTAPFAVASNGRISTLVLSRAKWASVSLRVFRQCAGLKNARLPITRAKVSYRLMCKAITYLHLRLMPFPAECSRSKSKLLSIYYRI